MKALEQLLTFTNGFEKIMSCSAVSQQQVDRYDHSYSSTEISLSLITQVFCQFSIIRQRLYSHCFKNVKAILVLVHLLSNLSAKYSPTDLVRFYLLSTQVIVPDRTLLCQTQKANTKLHYLPELLLSKLTQMALLQWIPQKNIQNIKSLSFFFSVISPK